MSLKESLTRGEQIVTSGKVHWAIFIPHVLLMAVYLIGVITVIPVLIRYFTTELTLTNKRLYGKYGLINTKSLDSPLNKITSISVTSGLLGKIFGYGNIHIATPTGEFVMKSIQNPTAFRDAVIMGMDKYEEDKIKMQAIEMANAIHSHTAMEYK